jgi:hypothetical protein
MTRVTCCSTLDLLFIRLSLSYDPSRVFGGLTQLTQFFLIDFFFIISSFTIIFDWKLSFMICFGLFFIKLSQPYDQRIMLNELIQVDLIYFCVNFQLKIL